MSIDILRCDEEGVPLLIQSITYGYSDFSFKVVYFEGSIIYISGDRIPSFDISDNSPTTMHFYEVMRIAERPEVYKQARDKKYLINLRQQCTSGYVYTQARDKK